MNLTEEDVRKVLRIVDALDYREVRLEYAGLKLYVRKAPVGEGDLADSGPAFEAKAAAAPAPVADKPAAIPADGLLAPSPTGHVIKAPLAGVVYHAPKPGAPPYVKVGQAINADDTVCLVEVMKLFQSVSAGIAGRITQVLVDDGSQIREGQALFAVDPN